MSNVLSWLPADDTSRGRRRVAAAKYTQRSTRFRDPVPSYSNIPTNRVYTVRKNQLIEEKLVSEKKKNAFSFYYKTPFVKEPDPKKPQSPIQAALESYKHADALIFAATSHIWLTEYHDDLKVLPNKRTTTLPSYASESGTFAYYRVVVDRGDKYTLVACHMNVHGFHRGDLRFVEVTNRTVTKGYESYSVIGNLFLGDIVAVSELVRKSTAPLIETDQRSLKKINQESECSWIVKKMTVLTRKMSDITFALLENGNAVAKGFEEVMMVRKNHRIKHEVDKLYTGTAFLPYKAEFEFTVDHELRHKIVLIAHYSKFSSHPKAFGTIHTYRNSPDETVLLNMGFDAFSRKGRLSEVDSDSVVETCALMGYSAANSIFNGRFDCRAFPMKNAQKHGPIVKFFIDNPKEQPTEGRWGCNNRIEIAAGCKDDMRKITGIIESVTAANGRLQIVVRVSRDTPKHLNFKDVIPIVKQREPMECSKLRNGFFKKMKEYSNGRRIIEALYGGAPMKTPNLPFEQFYFNEIDLNKYQCEYVSMIIAKTPLVLGSSPFGCGKSMTIVATAVEVFLAQKKPAHQLLITQSNYASVNLVDIAKKVKLKKLKFVRYVSESNWKELPDNCRTSYDMPVLMRTVFAKWARGLYEEAANKRLGFRHKVSMIYYVTDRKILMPNELGGEAKKVYDRLQRMETPWHGGLIGAFFVLYQPDVIMTTADSLGGLLNIKAIKTVSTVQIDEASQLPEYTLMSLLWRFPDACFGLIGDVKQLPPYCEDQLKGKLKDHGVGDTMERALKANMFPQAVLRYVYRCHPVITELLSDLFYEGQLISGVKEKDRNEFITKRSDFWPNNKFPIMVVDNQEKAKKMGTSWSNAAEARLVKEFVQLITAPHNGYQLKAEDVGVISFYAAQTSVLTEELRGTGVKCGTVDAFQGTEREVVILCCTNEKFSDFMQLPNRLNVAISRARQATIVIGNVEGLKKANYWSTIVQKAEENGCQMVMGGSAQKPDTRGSQKWKQQQQNKKKPQNQKKVQENGQPDKPANKIRKRNNKNKNNNGNLKKMQNKFKNVNINK